MKQIFYQVDAFASQPFGGNPAGVCPLKEWLPDEVMQKIAAENNIAETAFFVPKENGFHLRWFTPAVEVDLCGHATLATSHVLFNHLGYAGDQINFQSKSGVLTVTKNNGLLTLDFPADVVKSEQASAELIEGIGVEPDEVYQGKTDYMLVYSSQKIIEQIDPDHRKVAGSNVRGIMVTAPGDEVDFVSRFFAPQSGIDEDPATGSAHTTMIPYWANRLGKSKMHALQLSTRLGELFCEHHGDRVKISGKAFTYLEGEINM
jgi:PhzF family phenazine biosynthesis protein